MKLKILLMPAAIIISAVLIIWHIYPAWFGEDAGSITNVKLSVEKKEKEISDIKSRKANIGKLAQSLESNSEIGDLVNKFYPIYRNDEDVINTINTIAFNEGVFMSAMVVEYLNITPSDDPVRILSLPLEKNNPIVTEGVQTPIDGNVPVVTIDDSGLSPDDLARTKMKFIEMGLGLTGTYDQLKKFIIASNNAGLINNIQIFKIYKKDNPNKEEDNSDILTVDMVMGFAYLPSSNENASNLLLKDLFNKDGFDFSEVENKKDILIGNYKQSEMGAVGLSNPFLEDSLSTE